MTNAELVQAGADANMDVWHWHITLYRELERLAAIGETSYPATGVAGNIRFTGADVRRYAREMIAAGLIRETSPQWDYADLWIGLP